MTDDNTKVYFSNLSETEKISVFRSSARRRSLITVWKKGDSKRVLFFIENNLSSTLILHSETQANYLPYLNEDVLFTIEQDATQYFGQGKLNFTSKLELHVPGTLYKSEKRKAYRLITYPQHSVHAVFKIGHLLDKTKNILDFNKHRTSEQTAIFKNFLKIMDTAQSPEIVYEDGDYYSFRVLDISSAGLAFRISPMYKTFFENNKKLDFLKILFYESEYMIDEVEVMHILNFIDTERPNLPLYKVGVKFLNMPEELSQKLTVQINKNIKASTENKKFEDFLK